MPTTEGDFEVKCLGLNSGGQVRTVGVKDGMAQSCDCPVNEVQCCHKIAVTTYVQDQYLQIL